MQRKGAVSGPLGVLSASLRRRRGHGQQVDPCPPHIAKLRHYDENGPGWVSSYLEYNSGLLRSFEFFWDEWDSEDATFRRSEDAQMAAWYAAHFIGTNGERDDALIGAIGRELLLAGEVALVRTDAGPFMVLPVHKGAFRVTEWDGPVSEMFGWPPSREVSLATARNDELIQFRADQIFRIYLADPRFPSDARSPMMGAIRSIEREDLAARVLHRQLGSLLAVNKILRVHGSEDDVGSVDPETEAFELGWLGQTLHELVDDSGRSIDDLDDRDPLNKLPFIWVSEHDDPIELIDLGSPVDPNILQAKNDAIRDAAQGLPGPTAAILNGVGGVSDRFQNSEALRQEVLRSLHPIASTIASALTTILLPIMAGDGVEVPTTVVRLVPDTTNVARNPPTTADLIETVQLGAASTRALIDHHNLERYALELPEGMSELDLRLALTQTRRARQGTDREVRG